jgi:hypothetical protein
MSEEEEAEADEVVEVVDESLVVLVAAIIDPAAVVLVEAALHHATHLRPLWERLMVGEEPEEGRTVLGLPLSNKVTSDSIENHSRHLFSLFNLLGVPLVSSPMMLDRFDVKRSALRTLNGPAPRSEKKKAAEAAKKAEAAKAEAEAAEAANTEESVEPLTE